MPARMTDMRATDNPPAPRFFCGAFSFPLLQVSKPAAVSTTDDWHETPAIPLKATGERSDE